MRAVGDIMERVVVDFELIVSEDGVVVWTEVPPEPSP